MTLIFKNVGKCKAPDSVLVQNKYLKTMFTSGLKETRERCATFDYPLVTRDDIAAYLIYLKWKRDGSKGHCPITTMTIGCMNLAGFWEDDEFIRRFPVPGVDMEQYSKLSPVATSIVAEDYIERIHTADLVWDRAVEDFTTVRPVIAKDIWATVENRFQVLTYLGMPTKRAMSLARREFEQIVPHINSTFRRSHVEIPPDTQLDQLDAEWRSLRKKRREIYTELFPFGNRWCRISFLAAMYHVHFEEIDQRIEVVENKYYERLNIVRQKAIQARAVKPIPNARMYLG